MQRPNVSVLVVDDKPALREVLETRLESWGYGVRVAADAASARAAVAELNGL